MNSSGTVENSYSTGLVTSTGFFVGGLIGSSSGTVTNSFWNTQSSGQVTSDGGIGKTTAEMKTQSTYTGWDYTNTWFPPAQDYPSLRCILTTPLSVELTTFTAYVHDNNVELNWETATEVNNYGFKVERQKSVFRNQNVKRLHLLKVTETATHQNIIYFLINPLKVLANIQID